MPSRKIDIFGKSSGTNIDGDGADDTDGIKMSQALDGIIDVEDDDGKNRGGDQRQPGNAEAVELGEMLG